LAVAGAKPRVEMVLQVVRVLVVLVGIQTVFQELLVKATQVVMDKT
jgi:hypothetical protein